MNFQEELYKRLALKAFLLTKKKKIFAQKLIHQCKNSLEFSEFCPKFTFYNPQENSTPFFQIAWTIFNKIMYDLNFYLSYLQTFQAHLRKCSKLEIKLKNYYTSVYIVL